MVAWKSCYRENEIICFCFWRKGTLDYAFHKKVKFWIDTAALNQGFTVWFNINKVAKI